MSAVKPILPTPVGNAGICHAQGMAAGPWVFATGHMAQAYPGGFVNIYWDRTFTFPNATGGRGAYGYYEVNNRGVQGVAGANIISLYAQTGENVNGMRIRLTQSNGTLRFICTNVAPGAQTTFVSATASS